MVNNEEIVKIIDFGFGKKIQYEQDFDKSISLNWWCDTPDDFLNKKYDFQTEVYFIGKLFEKIIIENEIEQFHYKELLSKMIPKDPNNRLESFNACYKLVLDQKSLDLNFNDFELETYRKFSNILFNLISKIEYSTKFIKDTDQIIKSLEELHKNTMLEEYLYDKSKLSKCFLNGTYYYNNNQYITIYTTQINEFLQLLKNCSKDKRNIIMNNLETRIDAIERYFPEIDEDDIPF